MLPKRVHLFYMLFVAAAAGISRADELPLDAILNRWEQAAAQIKRLDCRFQRFHYAPVLGVEHRSSGKIALVSPLHAGIVIERPAAKTAVSRLKDAQGVPLRLELEEPARLIRAPGELTRINTTAGTYRRIKTADDASPSHFPLPGFFLIGTTAEELKQRYHIAVLKQSSSEIWLRLRPKTDGEQGAVATTNVQLILDAVGYFPKALRLADSGESGEATVFTFTDRRINHAPGHDDPLVANLEQLREEE